MDRMTSGDPQVSSCLKRQAVELKFLIDRSTEDIVNVKTDMKQLYSSLLDLHTRKTEAINFNNFSDDAEDRAAESTSHAN